ncbi:hypothetical protein [Streptomyces chrestomyceticus]|uniref:hypothetical protein n=1 Tax=Streptomyces chrestomyceticus TaxID=68185 RepID=UPI0033C1FA48
MMMTGRGMAAPAAGGSVLAAFDAVLAASVPELAGRVQAVAFDADTGRLDIVPAAPAVGTKLRWSAPKLIAAANARVHDANVRALHVLAPAPVKTGPTTTAAAPALPAVPVERRPPPGGYRRAIEAHRQAAPPPRVNPAIANRTAGRPPAAGRSPRRCTARPAPECGAEPARRQEDEAALLSGDRLVAPPAAGRSK